MDNLFLTKFRINELADIQDWVTFGEQQNTSDN